ncbi:hypothetical protein BH23GEM1_BH23GEM1_11720 [soil metagenome]
MRNINLSRLALAVSLLSSTALACKGKDAAETDTTAIGTPAPAAFRVTDIQLGKRIGSDKRVTESSTTFGTRDTIYVSVVTDGAASGTRLSASWQYNNSQTVSESEETVTTTGETNVSEFHISKATPWPTGAYKVEIKVNGTPAGSRDFQIQ